MKRKTNFIRAVLVVFGGLILSRIPLLAAGELDTVTVVSTVVELIFFAWGLSLLLKRN